jgi:hypothetical protein
MKMRHIIQPENAKGKNKLCDLSIDGIILK